MDDLVSQHRPMTPWFEIIPGTLAVHVITVRFCLGQGARPSLVQQRLRLFEAIHAPSLQQQTPKRRFAWIVHTDSTLGHAARARLARTGAAIVSAPLGKLRYDWGAVAQLALVPAELGWSTPPARLLANSSRRVYLSTRLDSDDGLPLGAVWRIQQALGRELLRHRPVYPHVACWHQQLGWEPSAAPHAKHGNFTLQRAPFCLSAGLTMLSDVDRSCYTIAHHKVEWRHGGIGRSTVTQLDSPESTWGKFATFPPLRSFTSTSDSASVNKDGPTWKRRQRASGVALGPRTLERLYGINHSALLDANRETLALASAIRAEAHVPTPCLKGFACTARGAWASEKGRLASRPSSEPPRHGRSVSDTAKPVRTRRHGDSPVS